ncbi:MAG: Fur family transcriptional regulator [Phycisphaerales bacterium]|nr:Fur family transcriptional regulator [Phycisphaerales bacterium]
MHGTCTELLRNHGLQVTTQRVAILESVSKHPHCTADTVKSDVRHRIGSISHQTVYDGLGALVQHGLLRRIQPAHSPARFETRTEDNHHHLICRSCGHMIDVDCRRGCAPCLEPTDTAGFDIDEAEVIYWGHCPKCRRTNNT